MSVQMCTCDTAVRLRDRISDLEVRLADALARNERLDVEAAATTLRADELERELANERELCNVLEEAVEDSSVIKCSPIWYLQGSDRIIGSLLDITFAIRFCRSGPRFINRVRSH
jgi:hypothetical protein